MRAVEEVEKLMELEPAERRLRIPHSRQPFEDMTIDDLLKKMVEENFSIEDLEIDMGEDEVLDDDDFEPAEDMDAEAPDESLDMDGEHTPSTPPKKKRKQAKGRKKQEAGALDESLENEGADSVPQLTQKKWNKTKGQKKQEADTWDTYVDDADPSQKKKKKAKGQQKQKIEAHDESAEMEDEATDSQIEKKTRKSRGKKKQVADAPGPAIADEDETLDDLRPIDKKKKKPKGQKKPLDDASDPTLAEEGVQESQFEEKATTSDELLSEDAMASKPVTEMVDGPSSDNSEGDEMDEDVPSDDDKDDFDYDEGDADADAEFGGDDNIEDHALEPSVQVKGKGGKKKTQGKTGSLSNKRKSDGAKARRSVGGRRDEIPPERKDGTQKRKWLQGRIKLNEKRIVPLLEKLHAVNEETPVVDIREMLTELDEHIERMCWQFFELHKVPNALKPAKKVLKSMTGDISLVTNLKEKMKAQYEQNKKDYDINPIKVVPCEASYLNPGASEKRDSIAASSRGGDSSSHKPPSSHNKGGDGRHRDRASMPQSEKGARKRPSVDVASQSDEIQQKRKTLDSLSQSDKRRESTGALSKSEKVSMKEESRKRKSDAGLQQRDSAGSLSRLDRPKKEVKAMSSLEKGEELDHSRTIKLKSELQDDDAVDVLRKSGVPSRTKEPVQPHIDSGSKSPAKPKPKKFSIASLMKSGGQEKGPSQPKPPSSRESYKAKKQLPAWMRSESPLSPPEGRNRLFALEFFKEMSRHFSSDKVNRDGMALALEAETYHWAQCKSGKDTETLQGGKPVAMDAKTNDMYWRKVRAIVAVVCGKYNPGTLMHDMMKGDFETARDLVELSDEKLSAYFKADLGY